MIPLCVADFREMARRRLPRFLFDYIDGGSYGELTLRRNVEDLQAIALRQRVMRDVSDVDLSATIFDRNVAMPVGLGPVGLAGMNARRGEVQAARAAEAAGIPFCLSTVSACSLEEVAAGVTQPFWFQLYAIRDRAFLRDLIGKAKGLGCDALVFTVDLPVPGVRYRDYRSGLAGASSWRGSMRRFAQALSRPRWAWDVGICGRPHSLGNVARVLEKSSGLEDFMAWMSRNFDPSITWRDLEWIRSEWPGTLLIKGILDPEDARAALAAGIDGIIVSNHGGRQLDGAPAPIDQVEEVVQAIGGRIEVILDGGVRRGSDILKAMALGADACSIGRPYLYGLAAGGRAGVARALSILRGEFERSMALAGVSRLADIGRSLVKRRK